MSNLKNRVQLIGHLGTDPEMKIFESGKMARFRIATNEAYKAASGEWKEETTWHSVIAWGPIAERVEKILHKGSYILVEGKLVHREYTNNQNEKRYITEVRISNFVLLDKRPGEGLAHSEPVVPAEAEDDGLPF